MELPSGDSSIAVIYVDGAIVNGSGGDSLFGGSNIGDHNSVVCPTSHWCWRQRIGCARFFTGRVWLRIRCHLERLHKGWKTSAFPLSSVEIVLLPVVTTCRWSVTTSLPSQTQSPVHWCFWRETQSWRSLQQVGMNLHIPTWGICQLTFSSTSTDAERAKYQEFLDGFWRGVHHQSSRRTQSHNRTDSPSGSRTGMTGTCALEHKLVDEIGGLNTIDRAAQFIDAEDYNVITIPQSKLFEDRSKTTKQLKPTDWATLPNWLLSLYKMHCSSNKCWLTTLVFQCYRWWLTFNKYT